MSKQVTLVTMHGFYSQPSLCTDLDWMLHFEWLSENDTLSDELGSSLQCKESPTKRLQHLYRR